METSENTKETEAEKGGKVETEGQGKNPQHNQEGKNNKMWKVTVNSRFKFLGNEKDRDKKESRTKEIQQQGGIQEPTKE